MVATAITACGFVTLEFFDKVLGVKVATAITACGFVTIIFLINSQYNAPVATAITACGFVTRKTCSPCILLY